MVHFQHQIEDGQNINKYCICLKFLSQSVHKKLGQLTPKNFMLKRGSTLHEGSNVICSKTRTDFSLYKSFLDHQILSEVTLWICDFKFMIQNENSYLIKQGLNLQVDELIAELSGPAHDVSNCGRT